PARSVGGRERLDLLSVADEGDHHPNAEDEEHRLQDVHAVFAEPEQVGEGPAGGKGRPKHFGADQDRRAHHREHVDPDHPAVLSESSVHTKWFPGPAGSAPAISPKPAAQSRAGLSDVATLTRRRAWPWGRAPPPPPARRGCGRSRRGKALPAAGVRPRAAGGRAAPAPLSCGCAYRPRARRRTPAQSD